MTELLEKSQIDQLLHMAKANSASQENLTAQVQDDAKKLDKQSYKKYNFYSQKKISKKKLKMLDGIYGSYARTISSYMSGLLRMGFTAELIGMEEERYYEFNNNLKENDLISTVNIFYPGSRDASNCLIQMSHGITLAAIDRLLGGEGIPDDFENGTYTDIELGVYETLVKKFIIHMKNAWDNYYPLDYKFYRYEANPRLVQSISPDEIVVVIEFNVMLEHTPGFLKICMPSTLLADVFEKMDKISQTGIKHQSIEDETNTSNLIYNLYNTELALRANLGIMQLTMADVFSIEEGDIIDLGLSSQSNVYLNIEGKPWFEGKLGTYHGKKAVRLQEACKQEKQLSED